MKDRKNIINLLNKNVVIQNDNIIIDKFETINVFDVNLINEKNIYINNIEVHQFSGYENKIGSIKDGIYYIVPKEIAIFFKRKDFLYIDENDILEINEKSIFATRLSRIKIQKN